MAQEVQSFWTDIKKYEDILLKDPNSYCFAQLSELYRKIGLLDDAIFVAMRGIEVHPDYVGGHLALGRAYFDKGQKANSREMLERVIRTTPENYSAQKLLSQLYLEQNDVDLALETLRTVLELNPDDVESRLSLEALSRSGVRDAEAVPCLEDEEELEDAEIVDDELLSQDAWTVEDSIPPAAGAELSEMSGFSVEDFPLWESLTEERTEGEGGDVLADAPLSAPDFEDTVSEAAGPSRDPLTTATLAEIYLAQGFHDQALKIFRELSDVAPDNDELRRRIAEIELLKADTVAVPTSPDHVVGVVEVLPSVAFTEAAPESGEDRAVAALEEWLECIKRRRACR